MQLVVISPPHSVAFETQLATKMLAAGLARFHVRKPGWGAAETAAYVAEIPGQYRARLVLHGHHALVKELALGGAHLTAASRSAHSLPRLRAGQTISTSFHSLAEIKQHRRRYDYVFLSPIFDSISKKSYGAAFDLGEVAATLQKLRQRPGYRPQVLALGGIESTNLAAAQQAGFAGAAVLGAVWQSPDPVAAFRTLQSVIG
ncbi:thiamine phosphate synthase [Hymenobacter ruricola]|uniref:Thiamine phosphate synthase n=1 Tax=Hymenobacter ruricola TaxID=2791023 RepID=A0ABS0I7S0_9BACT|nr:thiamine phosphate synthase [Hymenobacter ruricola]MBF9222934.1 thiamine phosphate synthase [Hymenobacter ruricola]